MKYIIMCNYNILSLCKLATLIILATVPSFSKGTLGTCLGPSNFWDPYVPKHSFQDGQIFNQGAFKGELQIMLEQHMWHKYIKWKYIFSICVIYTR